MLSVEISTIYKRDGRTRKVHHLLYAPSLEVSCAITASLAKIFTEPAPKCVSGPDVPVRGQSQVIRQLA